MRSVIICHRMEVSVDELLRSVCNKCGEVQECPFAFDPYNDEESCLMDK